jgi:hypothetical protein
VIQFDDEGNSVCVFSGHHRKDPKSAGNCITSAFESQAYNIFGIEILRIFCKRSTGAVFNTLIYGKYGEISGSRQSSIIEQLLQTA